MSKYKWSAVVLAAMLGLSACASSEKDAEGTNATAKEGEQEEVSQTKDDTNQGGAESVPAAVALFSDDPASLGEAVGAEFVAAFSSDEGTEVTITGQDEPRIFTAEEAVSSHGSYFYSLSRGGILDASGELVCDFEILGDYHVITAISEGEQAPLVHVEDRRSSVQGVELGDGEYELARSVYDCETETSEDVESGRVTVSRGGEKVLRTIEGGEQSFLLAEFLGDSPVELLNVEEETIIPASSGAFEFVFTQDGSTAVFSSYEEFFALAAPTSVKAFDTATGEEKWSVDLVGVPYIVEDKVIVEVLDDSVPPGPSGTFPTIEVVVLDLETGDELQRGDFTSSIQFIK